MHKHDRPNRLVGLSELTDKTNHGDNELNDAKHNEVIDSARVQWTH